MADIEEILQFADSEPIDKKSINCGFVFGYRNAKELYKEAIDKVMAENRRLKEKNILLRCNNESLNEKLEKRLK